MKIPLQPLRVCAGWQVGWNAFFELDPTEANIRAGYFGGSSIFSATNHDRRLHVDVEWRPEDDASGEFCLTVDYVPWQRTATGRRRKGVPLDFRDSTIVHDFRTRSRTELVRELEEVFRIRDEWIEHN